MRWSGRLTGLQSALSVAVFLAAALLLVNLWQSAHVPTGFDGERLFAVEMELSSPKYVFAPPPPPPPPEPGARVTPAPPKPASPRPTTRRIAPTAAVNTFHQQLITRVLSLPGVIDAGTTSALPFQNPTMGTQVRRLSVPGVPASLGYVFYVDPGYFPALKVPVLRGRNFTRDDILGRPRIVMISNKVARELFGDEDPIGQFVDMHGPVEVVGVVGEIRSRTVEKNPEPALYVPQAQSTNIRICLVVRVGPGADDVEAGIRGVVLSLDPDLAIISVKPIEPMVAASR